MEWEKRPQRKGRAEANKRIAEFASAEAAASLEEDNDSDYEMFINKHKQSNLTPPSFLSDALHVHVLTLCACTCT